MVFSGGGVPFNVILPEISPAWTEAITPAAASIVSRPKMASGVLLIFVFIVKFMSRLQYHALFVSQEMASVF